MPSAFPHACATHGCPAITRERYCDAHRREAFKGLREMRRGSARERGYTTAWDKARKQYLRDNPLCVRCGESGALTGATVVDHIIPHRGDMAKFWDVSNWQSLCVVHHNKKTASGQ